jgi:hypothetical protein
MKYLIKYSIVRIIKVNLFFIFKKGILVQYLKHDMMKKIVVFIALILLYSCKKEDKGTGDLGVINLNVTGNKAALPVFEKGLLLLHSFEYMDSREAFLEAQKIDPQMPMAYWGEAMTYNHPLWREQDLNDASEVLERMSENCNNKNLSAIEKDLIDGAKILYQPKKAKTDRDQLYMIHMKELYKKYPNQNEVAAFYALSLLGSVSDKRKDSIYGLGAHIANEVLKRNNQHPGALHYLIHSYDDPIHAHLALNAANSYAKVAPDASHALHMPSHIYVALGMWDEVVLSNVDSYGASINRMKRKGLDNDARGYHAYHWLEYGYLQKAEVEKASKMVWDMEKYTSETPSKVARTHMVFLKGTYLMETNKWQDSIANIKIDDAGLNIGVKSQNYFIEGMKAFKAGNNVVLDSIIEAMNSEIKKESLLVDNLSKGFSLCASASRDTPNQNDIRASIIMKTQLLALSSWLSGDSVNTEALLKEAVHLNDELQYSYGPPFIQKPTIELYADFLLEQQRAKEALMFYQKALTTGTNRLAALNGVKISSSIINGLN